jgi:hypothetical protein
MTARDVICETLATDRHDPHEFIETAQSILDALQAAGYWLMRPITAEEEAANNW